MLFQHNIPVFFMPKCTFTNQPIRMYINLLNSLTIFSYKHYITRVSTVGEFSKCESWRTSKVLTSPYLWNKSGRTVWMKYRETFCGLAGLLTLSLSPTRAPVSSTVFPCPSRGADPLRTWVPFQTGARRWAVFPRNMFCSEWNETVVLSLKSC